jgi:hypothetical protein
MIALFAALQQLALRCVIDSCVVDVSQPLKTLDGIVAIYGEKPALGKYRQ